MKKCNLQRDASKLNNYKKGIFRNVGFEKDWIFLLFFPLFFLFILCSSRCRLPLVLDLAMGAEEEGEKH